MASTSDGTEPAAASSTTPCPRTNAMASSGVTCALLCNLTVKLSGRAQVPDQRRGRTLSPRARGAQPPTPPGRLQRIVRGVPTNAPRIVHVLQLHKPQTG